MTSKRKHLMSIALGLSLVGLPAITIAGEDEPEPIEIPGISLPRIVTPDTTPPVPLPGFSVAAQGIDIHDTPAAAAIEHIQQRQWVRAIHAIEEIDADDPRMAIDHHGVLRPIGTIKRSLTADLPDEGRDVFRRLNNTAAQNLLDRAHALADLTQRERAYATLVNDYAPCDASAQAAQLLGDIRFEQGRFTDAADLYAFAAGHHASASDDPAIMARRLIALSRAENWQDFDTLADYARFRHADAPVELGGQAVALGELIEQFARARGPIEAADADENTRAAETISLRFEDAPALDHLFISPATYEGLQTAATNNRIAPAAQTLLRPVVATDGDRLFTNTLGSIARIDPQTGDDIWRLYDADANAGAAASLLNMLSHGYYQSLTIVGDTVLATGPGDFATFVNNQITTGRQYFRHSPLANATLIAIDANTGETRWFWPYSGLALGPSSVVGTPLAVGDRVYLTTLDWETAEFLLVALDLDTGEQIQHTGLGHAASIVGINVPAEMSPRLAMGRSNLLVQTNNGALIAVDPDDFTIAWAHTQDIRESWIERLRRHRYAPPGSIARHTGTVVAQHGLVIAKDTRSDTIHALREADGELLWSATTDADATIVHHDNQRIYVLGSQLTAYDIRTGERVWWTPHAGHEPGTPVFTDSQCVMLGHHRLCAIDLETGRLTDVREDVPGPADLYRVGNQLIRVSGNELVGYALPGTQNH